MFTGGVFDTNGFLYRAPEGAILFDAPQGVDEALAGEKVDLLLLTHGHFDHIADAAAVIRRHRCRVGFHPDTRPMAENPDFFRLFGLSLEVEPFSADFLMEEGDATHLGAGIRSLEVPGHCPGSLCFFLPGENLLVGGDVLFRGGTGRWDLPGGDRELLFEGIRRKIFPLGDDVVILPGHGPATTVGEERKRGLFLEE